MNLLLRTKWLPLAFLMFFSWAFIHPNLIYSASFHGSSSYPSFYTVVWLSDTQYYSEKYPHIFHKQIDWMINEREKWNIQYVIHTGDIVNRAEKNEQWLVADSVFAKLDQANIPYGVLAGNHDLTYGVFYQKYWQYFGQDRFQKKPYYGGSFQNNRGHYDLITIGNRSFLFLYLGWGIDKEGISWMNQVLRLYPDRTAIIATHKYLHKSGKRTFIGNRIFQKVVKKNQNVKMVLCGHYDNSQMVKTEIDDDHDGKPDRTVYEILADYQGGPNGGNGFLRLLHFYPDASKIFVRAYSPYTDQFYYFPREKEEFWIDYE